jgi:hypothetical protein
MTSQGRVEQQMDCQGSDLREMRQSLNWIAAAISSREEGSILTSYAGDDKAVWKELRRELIKEGYPSNIISTHKETIMEYIMELGERGILDDISAICNENEAASSNPRAKSTERISMSHLSFDASDLASHVDGLPSGNSDEDNDESDDSLEFTESQNQPLANSPTPEFGAHEDEREFAQEDGYDPFSRIDASRQVPLVVPEDAPEDLLTVQLLGLKCWNCHKSSGWMTSEVFDCEHDWCMECLRTAFTKSLVNTSDMPPKVLYTELSYTSLCSHCCISHR